LCVGVALVDPRIQKVCVAHPARSDLDLSALITVVDGVWALCEGHGPGSHEWVDIPPTHPQFATDAVPDETKRQWWRRWWQRVRKAGGSSGTDIGPRP
jgi:hypothetical protein